MVSQATVASLVSAYDPDAPPPPEPRRFLGRLTTSLYVDPRGADYAGLPERARIAYERYVAKATRTIGPVWFLEAEGIDVAREDGQPFRQSDLLTLTDKDGSWLRGNMAPDIFAKAYRDLGVSASYLKVGQPDSAVGRIFQFEEHEVKLGRSFTKTFRLWPVELFAEGFTYAGDVRVAKSSRTTETDEVPANGAVSQEEAVALLKQTLQGQPIDKAFDLLMDNAQLKTVGTVHGVALVEAASVDGAPELVAMLEQNGILTAQGGVFQTP